MMADACFAAKRDMIAELGRQAEQRRMLILVMLTNPARFIAELGGGGVARSSALMAGSAEKLGDAVVYALSLFAPHRGARSEAGAALAKRSIILALGLAVFAEIADTVANGFAHAPAFMLGAASDALIANLICSALLWRSFRPKMNMSSTFGCSRDDFASNVGVLAAAGSIGLTGPAWPGRASSSAALWL